MLNPFPSLLIFTFFAPTVLRVTAALFLLYIAWRMFKTKETIAAQCLPLIGNPSEWMVSFSALITALVAFGLFVGYETQWSAILGMIISLKHLIGMRRFTSILPLSRSSYILLFIICFSLLITGSGAFAFDVPL